MSNIKRKNKIKRLYNFGEQELEFDNSLHAFQSKKRYPRKPSFNQMVKIYYE